MPWLGYISSSNFPVNDDEPHFLPAKNREKHAFLKNKAGELLKTKDQPKKQTENKAETKRAMSLKTNDRPKKQSGNKPENKATQRNENTGSVKNKPETERRKSAALLTA
ncbi:MAG: hypothetical protein P8Z30_11660 [Acidobacteriota bacterium]